eukprot:TRINITY_DN7821_c1_g1_i4.p2 TRINITY_DN7821_c1_g1~~TRINITY_DN7821_c1_g1_i4.p2  ORF type:complete len:164 (-),score=8.83 TRINITY_DN7821_c1_g1_i4:160-651(-)
MSLRLQGVSGQKSVGQFQQYGRFQRIAVQQKRVQSAKRKRLDVVAVIPMLSGDATEQTPPDLPSYLFKERIVYLGMSLVPSVTELLLAELLYLQYDNPTKPIYMYINSSICSLFLKVPTTVSPFWAAYLASSFPKPVEQPVTNQIFPISFVFSLRYKLLFPIK